MLPPNIEGLKRVFLEDIILLSQKIRSFVDQTCKTAEDAANEMFSETDVLSRAATLVLKVKECREKLAVIAAAIPFETVKCNTISPAVPFEAENQTQTLPLCQVAPATVTYGVPYAVKILQQGTPSRFWLQLQSSCYSEIELRLKAHYTNTKPLNVMPVLGSYAVCKQANSFFRGKVIASYKWDNQQESANVGLVLVDSGETAKVRLNEIYKIHESFCREPAQGLLCCMHNIEPANKVWQSDAIRYFFDLCENLIATFHPPPSGVREPFSEYESDFYVSLQTVKDGKATDISSMMIKNRMALPLTKQLQLYPVLSTDSAPQNSTPIHSNSNGDAGRTLKSSKKISPCSQYDRTRESLSLPRNSTPVPYSTARSPSVQNLNTTLKTSINAETVLNQLHCSPPQTLQAPLSNICSASKQSVVSFKTDFAPIANGNAPLSSDTIINKEEDMEEVFDPPLSRTIGEDVCCVRPADALLMQQFLNSLPNTAAPSTTGLDDSFVTARSSLHNQDSVEGLRIGEQPPLTEYMQYEYGTSLKPRPLPTTKDSSFYLKFTVSQIYSPTHFYVLPENDLMILEDLAKVLNEAYQNSNPVPVIQPDIGSFWVIWSELQKCWARVKIVRIKGTKTEEIKNPCENTCYVFLVDLGAFETVRVSTLRPLVQDILDIPCIALRCRMVGIYPYGDSPHSEDWPDKASEKFRELVSSEAESIALIDSVDEEQEVLSVIFLYNKSEENYSINEMLVGLRLASSNVFKDVDEILENATEDPNETTEEAWNDWNPMAEDFTSAKNTLYLDPENYDSVTTGYIPQDEKLICRFFRAQGHCNKGIRCNQLHIQPQPYNLTEDKTLVYVDVPSLPRLPIGGILSVQITCVMNAFRFFAILTHGVKDLRAKASVLDDSHNLELFQTELQQAYNQASQKYKFVTPPALGDIVIARSPEDDKWYRGRIVEDNQQDYYVVFFIDYGNQQEVHLRNICNPLPRFMHLPAQAVEMYLSGVERSGDSCCAEAKNALIQLVKERDLIARVLFDEPYVCVDLYDTSGQDKVDIAATLVKEKYVRPAPKEICYTPFSGKFLAG